MELSTLYNFRHLAPQLTLIAWALVLLLVDLFVKRKKIVWFGSVVALLSTLALNIDFIVNPVHGVINAPLGDMATSDGFSLYFNAVFLIFGILTLFLAEDYLAGHDIMRGEFYNIILWSIVGLMFIASGWDLIVIFLGLEILSVGLYVLAGINKNYFASKEAALKYFLLGAFSTGFLLYGMSLIYGAFGTTSLRRLQELVSTIEPAAFQNLTPVGEGSTQLILLLAGGILLLIGFAFKVSLVPFHMWTPDVYEGAPSPVTGFMAAAPKAGGFAAILKIFYLCFGERAGSYIEIFAILSVATLFTGNLLALVQTNLKRMLAYSSITHIGYLFLGLTAASAQAATAVMYYTLIYGLMNLGAFAVISHLTRTSEEAATLDGIKGMAYTRPYISMVLALFMFSLAGIPPTAGFAGKFYIFSALIARESYLLAVIGVLNSALALYYYLNVVVHLYMKGEENPIQTESLSFTAHVAVLLSAAGVLVLGILPGSLFGILSTAFRDLVR